MQLNIFLLKDNSGDTHTNERKKAIWSLNHSKTSSSHRDRYHCKIKFSSAGGGWIRAHARASGAMGDNQTRLREFRKNCFPKADNPVLTNSAAAALHNTGITLS